MNCYDTFIIGHLSRDEILYQGTTENLLGGAVLYAAYAAMAGGNKTGLLTKIARGSEELLQEFSVPATDVHWLYSQDDTAIRNEFLSDDRERRLCTALSIADPFLSEDIPAVDSAVYHLAGLIAGDFPEELIDVLAGRGKLAVDMQGFLRHAENGVMVFKDWQNKQQCLSKITYLKVDAAEAEIMTGLTDRREAARQLHAWGAGEVMVTHNTEALIYDGSEFYTVPLRSRNLSGRTGRGDSCFSAYITERQRQAIPEALLYAAALVSLKMETPGPFRGSRYDVEAYIDQVYRDAC
ncbi:ribokinase [Anaerosporomusa subterranea]|uniref:Ribokinase n=1 Tax=Anaerosporomusa subterranea TaxID=1794912 RepID=A0A154BRS6_ANASB|nr:PfkB family carbohydrate kinase [Anaerosporomusa subterranea]KYZ76597.1 ribokinase [Anaerosporomusa subterranea]